MWFGCGLDQTPLLLGGDKLACVGSIWSKYNLWFSLLDPKRHKFVTCGWRLIFSFRPHISNLCCYRKSKWTKQIVLAYPPGVFKAAHVYYNYLNLRHPLCYKHLLAKGTLFSHNQQVLCNRVCSTYNCSVRLQVWKWFPATTVSSCYFSLNSDV